MSRAKACSSDLCVGMPGDALCCRKIRFLPVLDATDGRLKRFCIVLAECYAFPFFVWHCTEWTVFLYCRGFFIVEVSSYGPGTFQRSAENMSLYVFSLALRSGRPLQGSKWNHYRTRICVSRFAGPSCGLDEGVALGLAARRLGRGWDKLSPSGIEGVLFPNVARN